MSCLGQCLLIDLDRQGLYPAAVTLVTVEGLADDRKGVVVLQDRFGLQDDVRVQVVVHDLDVRRVLGLDRLDELLELKLISPLVDDNLYVLALEIREEDTGKRPVLPVVHLLEHGVRVRDELELPGLGVEDVEPAGVVVVTPGELPVGAEVMKTSPGRLGMEVTGGRDVELVE